jgi:sugar phosphate isomerase/epimerase
LAVHLSDWKMPRHFADRKLPGHGIMPLQNWLSGFAEAGYRGTYTLEIFSDLSLPDSLWKTPARTVQLAKESFSKLWAEATSDDTNAAALFEAPAIRC